MLLSCAMSEMCRLIVLSESGTESILEAAASPSIREHRSFAAGRINVSPVVCAFPALAICNATRYDASVAFPFSLTKSSTIFYWPWNVWSFFWKNSGGFSVTSSTCLDSRCRRSFAGLMLSLAKISWPLDTHTADLNKTFYFGMRLIVTALVIFCTNFY